MAGTDTLDDVPPPFEASTHPLAVHLTSLHAAAEYYQSVARDATERLNGCMLRAQLAEEGEARERALRMAMERELELFRRRQPVVGIDEDPRLELEKQSLLLTRTQLDLSSTQTSLVRSEALLESTRRTLDEEREAHRALRRKHENAERHAKALEGVVGEYARLVRRLEGRVRADEPEGPITMVSPALLGVEDEKGGWLSGWKSWSPSPLASPASSSVDLTAPPRSDGRDDCAVREEALKAQVRLAENERELEAVEAVAEQLAGEVAGLRVEMVRRDADEATALKMVHHYTSHASHSQNLLHARLQSLQSTATTLNSALETALTRLASSQERLMIQASALADESAARQREAAARAGLAIREERIASWIQEVLHRFRRLLLAASSPALDETTFRTQLATLSRQLQQDAETLALVPCQPSPSKSMIDADAGSPLESIAREPGMARMLAHEDLVLSLFGELEDLREQRHGRSEGEADGQTKLVGTVANAAANPQRDDSRSSQSVCTDSTDTSGLDEAAPARAPVTSIKEANIASHANGDTSRETAGEKSIPETAEGLYSPFERPQSLAEQASAGERTVDSPSLSRGQVSPFRQLQTSLARLALSLDALRSNVAFTAALTPAATSLEAPTKRPNPAQDLLYLTAILTRHVARLRTDVDEASGEVERAATASSALALLNSPRGGVSGSDGPGAASEAIEAHQSDFLKRMDALESDVAALRDVARKVAARVDIPSPLTTQDVRLSEPTLREESPLRALWSSLPAALTGSPTRTPPSPLFGESVALATSPPVKSANEPIDDPFAALQLRSIPNWQELIRVGPETPQGRTAFKTCRKMPSTPSLQHHVGLSSVSPARPGHWGGKAGLASLRRQRTTTSRGSKDWSRVTRVSLEVE